MSWTKSVGWLRDLAPTDEGVWAVKDGKVAIGVVLLADWSDQIAVVRKESVPGYEFSEMLALPGGLVRGDDAIPFDQCFEQTVILRADDEAGLKREHLAGLQLATPDFVPVTRYTVKGRERFTAVFTVRASVEKAVRLESARKSIREAFFVTLPLQWKSFAPANRLILARVLAPGLGAEERAANKHAIDEALGLCNGAAEAAGLPRLPHPWFGEPA